MAEISTISTIPTQERRNAHEYVMNPESFLSNFRGSLQEWEDEDPDGNDYRSDSQREIDEMNRDFWKECGDAGSNCESWPGWD